MSFFLKFLAYACGTPYGDMYLPALFGSGGGGSSNSSGAGGGILKFTVGTMIVDGAISVDGRAGNTYVGGGSGGSLLMYIDKLKGRGSITVITFLMFQGIIQYQL